MKTVILKTFVFAVLAVSLFGLVFTASAQSKQRASADELDMAIRDASDYLNGNIPKGSKIVILNMESVSANLSEYIIDELIANAVNDKMFSVVDRRQLETIKSEQKFQMSGVVDDKDAVAIGKFFGAHTIISGTMREIGGRYRLTIRALSVQTAEVQGQYNKNIPLSATLTALANSGGGRAAGGAPTYGEANRPAESGPEETAKGNEAPKQKQARPSGQDLNQIIDRYEKLLEQCAVKKTDRCADVMYTLANLYRDNDDDNGGDYSKSIKMYEQLLVEYPKYPKTHDAKQQIEVLKSKNQKR